MDDDQQFCLRWNNHQSTLISVFDTLLENETLVDCTLAAEGKFLKAHKVVLSACSPYFATLLQEQYDKHPIFILKDVKYQELRAMMDYMYRGEVNISQDQLAALLKAAESLQIKGLSDNRSGGSGTTAPKPEHHRATMPTGKLSAGYTLEQTKRARIAGPAEPEMGSREGSSSPSRRRRKVRRRSIENAMTDVHDNSNSSQQQQQQLQLQQTQSNASGLGAITAAASALAAAAAAVPNASSLASNIPLSASTSSSSTAVATAPGTTLSSSKKTDIVKGTTQQQHTQQLDAMNTENVQGPAASAVTATGSIDTETTDATGIAAGAGTTTASEKSNHKQQQKQAKDSLNAGSATELVIEPKAEYDDEANDEPVEDLTLDEEDMGMDDLDQNAGTSQGGEGSSQGYAPWQHDRSQDELLLATQEAQQRDPQGDSTPLRSSSSFLHRRRQSIRLKTSPRTSPLPTGSGVIKYEPSTGLDYNDEDDDDDEHKLVVSGLEHKPSTSGVGGMTRGLGGDDDDEDDDEESEQPCDLRLSSHFKLNLVSMALQQAAAVAAKGDQQTAAAMAAAMMSSSGAAAVAGGSSGMPPATQLQQAALQIAAVATSHQAPHHSLHHPTQAQQVAAAAAHHALMNFPTGAASPSRRYSTSSVGGGGGGSGGGSGAVMPSGSGLMAGTPTGSGASGSGILTPSSSSALIGASTSTIVAPHTPSSSGGSSGGMMGGGGQGVAGPGSAGATGASGSGGSGGSTTTWGGAYTCDRCGNSYARPHSLNRHVRFECGVEPKFECPICHKKSKHKHNLVLHMRTHQHR
ncbi:longitudinals lacking isoform 6-T10 [Cochliomyia hominivorax]